MKRSSLRFLSKRLRFSDNRRVAKMLTFAHRAARQSLGAHQSSRLQLRCRTNKNRLKPKSTPTREQWFKMTKFVFWSGAYNVGLGAFLAFPSLYRAFGLNIPTPFWGWLVGGFLAYTGAMLILSSRDLRRRASLVYWESFLRYIAALLLIPAGLFGGLGLIAVPLGLGDLAIGLVYMFGLPKELGVSHKSLFCDRQNAA